MWCLGELRVWTRDDDGAWFAQVQFRPPGSHSRVIGAFPAEDVRYGLHRPLTRAALGKWPGSVMVARVHRVYLRSSKAEGQRGWAPDIGALGQAVTMA